MYILEHKKLYIVPEPLRKNRCCHLTAGNRFACAVIDLCLRRRLPNGEIRRSGESQKQQMIKEKYAKTAGAKMDKEVADETERTN